MAATIRFSVAASALTPTASPQAARTAGATWTTTIFSGSATAWRTLWVSSRTVSAPTGQWVMHCPHRAQFTSRMLFPPATSTLARFPVPVKDQTPRVCTFSHTLTQRRHWIHREASRTSGKVLSHLLEKGFFSKGSSCRFRSRATFCSLQFPLRMQVVQDTLCWLRISCTLIRLASRTRGVAVRTTIPSSATVAQAALSRSCPSISTTHTRQAPISFRSFR